MLIDFSHVYKSFYSKEEVTDVLKDLSFMVDKGEIVAIVGPSGCGKSTILNLISKLIKQDSGKIEINGTIGYMFQHDNLFSWRNVYKNITLGLEINHLPIDEKKIDNLLDKYGLLSFKNYYPSELSGGMKQRIALIRTLLLNPDILLLDEPFSSLDYQSKIIVQEDIYNMIKKENKTTILVTHDITEAIALADKVYVLSSRPSTIKKCFLINLNIENKTPLKARNSPKFQEFFSLIWNELTNNLQEGYHG